MPHKGEMTLMAGLVVAIVGMVLYCIGHAFSEIDGPPIPTPETGAAIIATGILIWLKGAMSLSLDTRDTNVVA